MGLRCWHDFVIKDATVKQLTLNVTDMDKIIKSTLSVHNLYLKCPPLAQTHARSLPRHRSVASSKINCSRPLHQTSMSCRFNSSILWISLW